MSAQTIGRIQFVTRHFNELQGLRYGVPLGLLTLSVGGTTYFANRPFLLLRALFFLGGLFLVLYARRYYRKAFGVVERQAIHPATQPGFLSIYNPAGSSPRIVDHQRVSTVVRHLLISMGLALTLLSILATVSPTVVITTDESLVQAPWLSSSYVFSGKDLGSTPLPLLKVQVMYALYGSLFLGVWFWRGRRSSQSHYLVFGVLLLGCSALNASRGFILPNALRSPRIIDAFIVPAAQFWIALLLCGIAMILTGLVDHWQLVRVFKPAVEE